MQTYDTIGKSYTQTRRADPRIANSIVRLLGLPPASVIADIGAGTGNYTNALADRGFQLHAVEPSAVMRVQAVPHANVQWHEGTAAHIPLGDSFVQGVVSTLAIHHFPDLGDAMREILRVVGTGPIVFLTFDYREIERLWLGDYFPKLWDDAIHSLPPLNQFAIEIEASAGRTVEIVPYPLPPDLVDMFLAAGWRRPEVYLDPNIRAGISSFANGDREEVELGIARLRGDLASGEWETQYGWVRSLIEIDAGYRYLVVK